MPEPLKPTEDQILAHHPQTCPQCGQLSLQLLPGATRRSCTFCHYVRDLSTTPLHAFETTPFQAEGAVLSVGRKRSALDLQQLLLFSLLLVAVWLAWDRFRQDPQGLRGFGAMEQSYHKVSRLLTHKLPAEALERKRLRWQLKRERVVIRHLDVSPCLELPRDWLVNLYALFEKEMETERFNFKNNRQILSVSSKFINTALECRDSFAPGQDTSLQLFTRFAD